jgi:hypothetical protein
MVKRMASVPVLGVIASGSMTLPVDLLIFLPLLVAHKGVHVHVLEGHSP